MATQSLYRRYRPRRFAELKGQDHVVHALRDAVANGREGQAYLFSGPRGTGKTTSARILAKVLNCENVVDGEPCCECASCLAVERGTSYDVHELDAASNNGVDAIRDLVEKASLGTPGRHKVYILDEVHMLSKAAEAALLKTLEEPPPHVVFVLATTDPQKMSDTIRSRTQHLQFHLLPSDTLADHVRWVAEDAGLDVDQTALDAALTQGGGSARDTLSALELIASTGGDTSGVVDLDEFLDGLAERDSGRVLTAMGYAVSMGRDPRAVTEELVRHLRNAFLALMAPELVVLPSERVDRIAEQAQRMGAATIVRAIERLGSILVDMRNAPDPRILVEVALVQLTNDQAGDDTDVLLARLERLEHTVKQLADGQAVAAAVPKDPTTGRAVLGGAARRPESSRIAPATTAPASNAAAVSGTSASEPPTPEAAAPEPAGGSEPAAADPVRPPVVAATPAPAPSMSVPDAWEQRVKSEVKPLVRALFSAGSFVGNRGDVWQFSVPNEAHGAKCGEHRADVERLLTAAVGAPVTIEFVTGGAGGAGSMPPEPDPAPTPPPASGRPAPSSAEATRPEPVAAPVVEAEPEPEPYVPEADEDVDLDALTDAPPESVKTPMDRIAEAFPGSELMTDD